MNILELDSYNLADAVKFNNRLNPRLWGKDENMLPEVRDHLMQIADDFREFLGVSGYELKDITVSGSNAAYTYTPSSDIDLHLIVDLPQADTNEVYRELFDAKKFQYNEQHNISIGGYPVELYVQDANKQHISQGIYSVMNNEWIDVPKRRDAGVDDVSTRSKYEDLTRRIDDAVNTGNKDTTAALMSTIKNMRQAGLDKHGEFGPENIAFKMLRAQGYIKRLLDARNSAKDAELSLKERTIEVHKPFTYGFRTTEDTVESINGVSDSTRMVINEKPVPAVTDVVSLFVDFCIEQLDIKQKPVIKFKRDPAWSARNKTFGRYNAENNLLEVSLSNRHVMDILRTVAHELTHKKQFEIAELPDNAGDTGSKWENEANAKAGVLMRNYAQLHPEYFEPDQIAEGSGYIPTKKQAKDPRFAMALTKDVKPGATGKEANKLGLQTDSQGHPALLMNNFVNALREFKETGKLPTKLGYGSMPFTQEPGGIEDQYGNQEAMGPEFPPQMPKHTSKIKVSDFTDWYQLGQDISDMDDAEPEDYNQGPPDTVIVFPNSDAKKTYEKQFKRLGLKTKNATDNTKIDESTLLEIDMSPSGLRARASELGAMVGMEFEMFVPNVAGIDNDDGDGNWDADYSEDIPVRSISQAVNFFDVDRDYNDTELSRLQNEMTQEHAEWASDSLSTQWEEERDDVVSQYVEQNSDLDLETATDEARSEFEADNISNYDELSWLRDTGLYKMTNVADYYEMDWPYITQTSNNQEGRSLEEVADEFSSAMDRPVNYSDRYHQGKRTTDGYTLEPDGSLDTDRYGVSGLEFISPPLPIDQMISDLNKVKQWATENDCYTNEQTGLHINVSIPKFDAAQLDYVKLALLLGDQYVLDLFGRTGNTYTGSALAIVKKRVAERPEDAAALLEKMRGNLESIATRAVHSGITNKFTSINNKSGYIEFRSPGGDWLGENFGNIENTLLRFVVALDSALNPEKDREEYLTKLYKLLAPAGSKNTIAYFAQYVAGKLPTAALKSFVRQAQLERKNTKANVATPVAAEVTGQFYLVDGDGMAVSTMPNPGTLTAARAQFLPRLARDSDPADYTIRSVTGSGQDYPLIAPTAPTVAAAPATKAYIVTDASGYSMLINAVNPMLAQEQAETQYPTRFTDVISTVLNTRGSTT